jgi:hypothetical protein
VVDGSYQFPGRWIGGIALIAGPMVWLTGVLLRLPFHFFFPQQLAAYEQAPGRMFAAYSCVLVGQILVALGVIAAATSSAGPDRPPRRPSSAKRMAALTSSRHSPWRSCSGGRFWRSAPGAPVCSPGGGRLRSRGC